MTAQTPDSSRHTDVESVFSDCAATAAGSDEEWENESKRSGGGQTRISTPTTTGVDHSNTDDESAEDGNSYGNEEYARLSRDVYSLMFYTDRKCNAFYFSLGVFFFQLLTISLIILDLFDDGRPGNPCGFPPNVSVQVRIAQLLACIVAVATQDDLITSITALHYGYQPDAFTRATGAAYWQWLFAIGCRFIEGGLCLVVTFLLVMQNSQVVELFLDFLAMEFISTLDDVSFHLSREGYFTRHLRDETKEVMKVQLRKVPRFSYIFRPLLFAFVCTCMMAGWITIVIKQESSAYHEYRLFSVQFDDYFETELPYFSGTYMLSNARHDARVVYYEMRPRPQGSTAPSAMFAYCNEEDAWTFSYSNDGDGDADPCDWAAKSGPTESYDLSSETASDWFVWDYETMAEVPFQQFVLKGADCDVDSDRANACNGAGRCEDRMCICEDGRFGVSCEFEAPCPNIEVDTALNEFPVGVNAERFADGYGLLRDADGRAVEVYGKPVYVSSSFEDSSGLDDTDDDVAYVILFTGRRWMLTTSRLMNLEENVTSRDLAESLATFHGRWSEYEAEFISEGTDVATPTDQASPVGLRWYRTKTQDNNAVDTTRPVDTLLLCALCNDVTNRCSNGGTCNAGTCMCRYGTFGTLCQVAGFILCRSIVAQFGDELVPTLGGFSGLYDLSDAQIGGRSVYIERSLGTAMFAYCDKQKFWTFTFWHPSDENPYEPCEGWTVRSIKSNAYDVTTLDKWFVRRNEDASVGVSFHSFSLSCNKCARLRESVCSNAGTCKNNACACDEGRYGLDCRFYEPCEKIKMDASQADLRTGWSDDNYARLRYENGTGVMVYQRPVYVSDGFHILMFTGRRWIATWLETHRALNGSVATDVLSDYLSTHFHGYWSDYDVEYISEPRDITDPTDTITPIGIRWYRAETYSKVADPDRLVSTSLLCSVCNNVYYPCYNGGTCTNGRCDCKYGTFGTLCQVDSLCLSITAQFSDEVVPDLGFFSGVFELAEDDFDDRPVYVDRFGSAMFAFCKQEVAWTFTYWRNHTMKPTDQNPCRDWSVKSKWSDSYALLDVQGQWFAREDKSSTEGTPLDRVSLLCNDCGHVTDRNKERGVCSRQGTCEKKTTQCDDIECQAKSCFCDEGRYGLNCEFVAPNPKLKSAWYGETLEFELIEDYSSDIVGGQARTLDQPVFAAPYQNSTCVILFSGRRWILFSWGGNESDLYHALTSVRPHWGFAPFDDVWAVSEAVDIDISTRTISPKISNWWLWRRVGDSPGFPAIIPTNKASFVPFSPCDEDEDACMNLGECIDGICSCRPCTSGRLCEIKGEADCKAVCFEEEGVGVAENLGCVCHSSCATCGYAVEPVSSESCLSCADGSAVIHDGHGGGRCSEPKIK